MRKLTTLIAMILMDFLLAAAIVSGIWYYMFKIPKKFMPPTGFISMVQANPQDSDQPAPSETNWKETFASHFTEDVQVTDTTYSSPNIAVTITKHSYGNGDDTVTYYLADLYIASLDCFRTKFGKDTYGIGYHEPLDVMAKETGAILAINGDSYCYDNRIDKGTLIRNSLLYRSGVTDYDTCVLYPDGTMKTYTPETFDPDAVIAAGAYQTWAFGPALLDPNGELPSSYNASSYVADNPHPRTAIGYYEPGHYCMLLADGRQTGYSRGMYLSEMSEIFHDLGCQAAYNLDGGHCSFMTFMSEFANQPYQYSDDVSDCIYIAEPS